MEPIHILNPDGSTHSKSRNLRGLRREVGKSTVKRVTAYRYSERDGGDGMLYVEFEDGRTCKVEFASFLVLCLTLHTWRNLHGVPCFIGEVVTHDGKLFKMPAHYVGHVGKTSYQPPHCVVESSMIPDPKWKPGKSMTYGVMPFKSQFYEAFAKTCERGTFKFGNDEYLGDVELTADELWDELLKRLKAYQYDDGSAGAWLSSVLYVLGFEWV